MNMDRNTVSRSLASTFGNRLKEKPDRAQPPRTTAAAGCEPNRAR